MPITQITEQEKCCGCGVCENICPKQCIKMVRNDEGFLYPEIEPINCIDCALCIKSCPINTTDILPQEHYTYPRSVFACRNIFDEIIMKSSSGGVFYELAKSVIDSGGIVFGVDFDEQHVVRHMKVSSITELPRLLGSKYVQSEKGNIWKEVRKELQTGKKVLFSGTPCETGALRSYLKKDYDNLLCVDFICMGTPSPSVWRRHINDIEGRYNSKAKKISFRTKKYGAYTHSLSLDFINGRKYWRPQFAEPYVKSFHSRLYLRPSCHNCTYKKSKRDSDITLADFWGIQSTDIRIPIDKGVSMVIVQSSKGNSAFNTVKERFECVETSMEIACRVQPMMTTSCTPHPEREVFFRQFNAETNKTFAEIINYFEPITWKDELRANLKSIGWLRKIVQHIKN